MQPSGQQPVQPAGQQPAAAGQQHEGQPPEGQPPEGQPPEGQQPAADSGEIVVPEEPADPIISIHDGAITESLLEEEREGYVANDAVEMFEANAVLEQEAEGREQLETLKWQVKHKRNQVKMLQEQVVAASTALTNRNRLIEEMGGRLGVLTSELTDMGARARDHELGDERAEETDGAAEVEDSSEAESDGSVGQML